MHDSKIYSYSQHEHPLQPWEWVLGDLAYIGNDRCITKIKKPNGGSLTDEQRLYNCITGHYRARAEHAVRHIRFHQRFSTPWRSSIETPQVLLLKVLIQTTAVDLELNQKYPGCSGSFGP